MHADLAQANLLRLRGDRDAAEKKCLSILKRYPNEPEAHSLLGELSADKEDYPRAIEWFELALDLNPHSAPDRARLDELKEKVNKTETAKTEEQLGLPPPVNYLPYIGAFVLLIVIIVAISALRAPKRVANGVKGGTIEAPRVLSRSSSGAEGETNNNSGAEGGAAEESVRTSGSASSLSMEDQTLMQGLQKGTYGGSILSVQEDPRDKTMLITYSAPKPDEARRVGAIIAKDALDRSTETLTVTVRGISGDQVIFVADGSRPKLAEIEGESNQDFQSGNDSWISTFLQREWEPSRSASTAPATSSEPAGQSPPAQGNAAPAPEPRSNGTSGATQTSSGAAGAPPGGTTPQTGSSTASQPISEPTSGSNT
jgi:hypothetical protein